MQLPSMLQDSTFKYQLFYKIVLFGNLSISDLPSLKCRECPAETQICFTHPNSKATILIQQFGVFLTFPEMRNETIIKNAAKSLLMRGSMLGN